MPSRFEILNADTRRLSCQTYAIDMERLCYKETQVILTCTKCGKLKTETTSN